MSTAAASIREQLSEENEDALFADGFDAALIGIARRCGQPSLAVYDHDKCLELLQEDMSPEEAEEYFSFNVLGAWVGDNTPLFVEVFKKSD